MFGIKRRFQRCKVWPPRFKESSVLFLLLSTNLAREWLQIDTDLLRIITSTADVLSGGTNIDDLERPWTRKIWVLSDFLAIFGSNAHLEWIFAEIYWKLTKTTCVRNETDAVAHLMSISSDFLFMLSLLHSMNSDCYRRWWEWLFVF